ncbi:hypothetical protein TrLO_g7017 [Triparma laevis f. longispina]|uniref:GIY-YIG domain-containing protein n=1 Tax=Triparma laevis f. longispina TaxID=1714387 RepID=A0A9W7ANY9_9STRA|nr:hypothetical protein TrLO_g7017 [Triparma laevis f. longispina]
MKVLLVYFLFLFCLSLVGTGSSSRTSGRSSRSYSSRSSVRPSRSYSSRSSGRTSRSYSKGYSTRTLPSRSSGRSSRSYSRGHSKRVSSSLPSGYSRDILRSKSPRPWYTYQLGLGKDKKYVGLTSNPRRRMRQHFSGSGAKFTQKNPPKKVDWVNKHASVEAAKRAEALAYFRAKRQFGDGVRGAGHTRSD